MLMVMFHVYIRSYQVTLYFQTVCMQLTLIQPSHIYTRTCTHIHMNALDCTLSVLGQVNLSICSVFNACDPISVHSDFSVLIFGGWPSKFGRLISYSDPVLYVATSQLQPECFVLCTLYVCICLLCECVCVRVCVCVWCVCVCVWCVCVCCTCVRVCVSNTLLT